MKSVLIFLNFSEKFEKRAENGCAHPQTAPKNFVCGSKCPIFDILTHKRNFWVRFGGVHTHFRPFFQIFLKNWKILEHFSYLCHSHSPFGWKVMRHWKVMKNRLNVPPFSPLYGQKWAKSSKMVQKRAKMAKNTQNWIFLKKN